MGGMWAGVWLEGGVGTGNASVCGPKSRVDCESPGRNANITGLQRCSSGTRFGTCVCGGGGDARGIPVGPSLWSWGLGTGLSSDPPSLGMGLGHRGEEDVLRGPCG